MKTKFTKTHVVTGKTTYIYGLRDRLDALKLLSRCLDTRGWTYIACRLSRGDTLRIGDHEYKYTWAPRRNNEESAIR